MLSTLSKETGVLFGFAEGKRNTKNEEMGRWMVKFFRKESRDGRDRENAPVEDQQNNVAN